MKQFIKFGIVGVLGFIVDSSLLIYCVDNLEFNIVVSRLISFSCAVFVTWGINRIFTFKYDNKSNKSKEYSKYFFIQVLGAMINFSIFITLIYMVDALKSMLLIPLFVGAIVSLFFNFKFTKMKVYNNG